MCDVYLFVEQLSSDLPSSMLVLASPDVEERNEAVLCVDVQDTVHMFIICRLIVGGASRNHVCLTLREPSGMLGALPQGL